MIGVFDRLEIDAMSLSLANSSSLSSADLSSDEDPDLKIEMGKFFDNPDVWFHSPCIDLGGMTPETAVADGREKDVRNILRLIKYVGMS